MYLLSLHFDAPLIRASLLKKRKNKIEICALKTAPEKSPDSILRLYKNHLRTSIISGLAGSDLLVRSMPTSALGAAKGRLLEAALLFQAESSSHLPLDEVQHVPVLVKKEKKEPHAIFYTASKKGLRSLLDRAFQVGLDPDRLTSCSLGLVRYIRWKLPTLNDAYIIDLSSEGWTCVWMEDGEIKKSFSTQQGTQGLIEAFWQDQRRILLERDVEGAAKRFDLTHYPTHNFPRLYELSSLLKADITKAILSFFQVGGAKTVIFTGRIDAFAHLCPFLLDGFREAASAECNSSLPQEELKYAISIGMALDSSLDLRKGDFFPAKMWRKRGLLALTTIFLSAALTSGVLWFGKRNVDSRTAELTALTKKELASWNLSLEGENLEMLLSRWAKDVHAHTNEFPFLQKSPHVAEVLAWLSQDPFFQELRLKKELPELLELRVRLLEAPRIHELKKNYKAQVDLEFRINNPVIGRQLHEFLLRSHDWVDTTQEVFWELLDNRCKTSFTLQNRTPYVP